MDLGLTRDVPFSYQLYQQRVWRVRGLGRGAMLELIQPRTMNEMVDRIEALVGIEVGDLNVRHQAVLNMLHQHYHDPPHAMQTATLALQLFDQLRPLHGLGAQAAEL